MGQIQQENAERSESIDGDTRGISLGKGATREAVENEGEVEVTKKKRRRGEGVMIENEVEAQGVMIMTVIVQVSSQFSSAKRRL
jgi:hypothetical protein